MKYANAYEEDLFYFIFFVKKYFIIYKNYFILRSNISLIKEWKIEKRKAEKKRRKGN